MSFKHFFRPFVGAMALLVASACGDATGPDFDGSFTEAQAAYVAEDAYGDLSYIVDQLDFGSPTVGLAGAEAVAARGFRGKAAARFAHGLQAAGAGCTVTASGTDEDPWDPYDGNDNGIPDDYSLTYDCVEIDSLAPGVSETEREVYRIRVKERAGVLRGWDGSSEWTAEEEVTGGDTYRERSKWTEHHSIKGDVATFGYDYVGDSREEEAEGATWVYAWGESLDASFDPNGTIVAGEPLPAGELDVTGRTYWDYGAEGALDFRLSSAAPLAYSPACRDDEGQPLVGGALRGLLNGDQAKGFLLTFHSCTNGSALEVFGNSDGAEE
jgi:hypothetical protein